MNTVCTSTNLKILRKIPSQYKSTCTCICMFTCLPGIPICSNTSTNQEKFNATCPHKPPQTGVYM